MGVFAGSPARVTQFRGLSGSNTYPDLIPGAWMWEEKKRRKYGCDQRTWHGVESVKSI